MGTKHFAALMGGLISSASRRTVLAGLSGGLLAAAPVVPGRDMAEARKKGKRRKKGKKQQQNPQQPPSPPGPVTRVDALCPGPSGTSLGSTDGNSRVAQTLAALASGALVRAELPIIKGAGTNGEYIVRLSPVDPSGFPTNAVLAETSVSNLSVPTGPSIVAFNFANPASVVAGTEYALVLTRPGSTHLQWEGNLGDSCSGGAFVSTDQTTAFIQPSESIDLIVTTFVSS
jgi:hypothetical protein